MKTEHITLSSPYKQVVKPFRIPAWSFVPGFLVAHLVVATCLPHRFDPLSTIFIVLAELAASLACIQAARADSMARGFWLLLIGAMVFHSAAMGMDAFTEITGAPMFNHVPALSVLLSMFCCVALLVAVSFQNDSRVLLAARFIHTLLSLAIGAVIFLEIFSFLRLSGSTNTSDAILVTRLFDAMDVFLAVAGTIRWLGSSQNQERGFFRVLMIFLWADAVCCGVHNRLLIRHDWVWLDLLISAPYVVLVPLVLTLRDRRGKSPSPGLVHAVRSGSPIFLASALVAVGVIETRSHLYVGLAATVFGIVGYGTLNILVQSRAFKTEEALMATKTDLERLIDLDGLTGIANRRAFDKALIREFATAIRTRHPVSLLMIDVDLFKGPERRRGSRQRRRVPGSHRRCTAVRITSQFGFCCSIRRRGVFRDSSCHRQRRSDDCRGEGSPRDRRSETCASYCARRGDYGQCRSLHLQRICAPLRSRSDGGGRSRPLHCQAAGAQPQRLPAVRQLSVEPKPRRGDKTARLKQLYRNRRRIPVSFTAPPWSSTRER